MAPMMRLILLSGMDQRQQDGLELEPVAPVAAAFEADDGNRTPFADRSQVAREHLPVLFAPAVEEVPAAQLRAEHLAQARAGEPILVGFRVDPLEHEGLGKDTGDPRRLDLQPLGREASSPHLVPVAVERL